MLGSQVRMVLPNGVSVLRFEGLLHHLWREEPWLQPILSQGTQHLSHVVGSHPHHSLFISTHSSSDPPPCPAEAHDK